MGEQTGRRGMGQRGRNSLPLPYFTRVVSLKAICGYSPWHHLPNPLVLGGCEYDKAWAANKERKQENKEPFSLPRFRKTAPHLAGHPLLGGLEPRLPEIDSEVV